MSTNRTRLGATAPLWASAIVVLALILTQSSRLVGNAARAEMVHGAGGYTIMTVDGGTDEVLVILDNRNEEMFVYRVENQAAVDLKERVSLTRLFSDARAAARGG